MPAEPRSRSCGWYKYVQLGVHHPIGSFISYPWPILCFYPSRSSPSMSRPPTRPSSAYPSRSGTPSLRDVVSLSVSILPFLISNHAPPSSPSPFFQIYLPSGPWRYENLPSREGIRSSSGTFFYQGFTIGVT